MTAPVTHEVAAAPAARRRLPLLRIAAIAAGIAVLLLLGRFAGGYLYGFAAWLQGLGAWGPIAFIAGYAVATLAFAPGSILTLAAGALLGIGPGVLYVFIAAVLGSSAAFLVSRYLAPRYRAGSPAIPASPRSTGRSGPRG
jgi:uncharacterized membrane protein YdjX (TVP38/TMEM64 family)